MKAKLGKKYCDSISGFTGTATCIAEFLYGCKRVTLSGIDNDGKPADFSFDEPGLEEVKDVKRKTPKQDTGGPRPMPSRTGY